MEESNVISQLFLSFDWLNKNVVIFACWSPISFCWEDFQGKSFLCIFSLDFRSTLLATRYNSLLPYK